MPSTGVKRNVVFPRCVNILAMHSPPPAASSLQEQIRISRAITTFMQRFLWRNVNISAVYATAKCIDLNCVVVNRCIDGRELVIVRVARKFGSAISRLLATAVALLVQKARIADSHR